MTTQTPISEEELRDKILGISFAFDIPPATVKNENVKLRIELEPLLELIKQYGNQCRVDELLGADDEVRLHNTVGESYQVWFMNRLAELTQTNEEE